MDPVTGSGGVILSEPLHPGPKASWPILAKSLTAREIKHELRKTKELLAMNRTPHIYSGREHNSPSLGYNVTLTFLHAVPKSLWEYGINGLVKPFSN